LLQLAKLALRICWAKFSKTKKHLVMADESDSPLVYSSTFEVTPSITGGSVLRCQCGWSGTMMMANELHYHTQKGARKKTHYLCRKSMHILAEMTYDPPISLEAMREAHDKRSDNSASIVTFE